MNLYLMKVAESATGSDPGLSDAGKKQAALMAAFLKRQIGRVDIIISGVEAATVETAEVMAAALGSYVATTTLLAPDRDTEDVWLEIDRLAQQSADVLIVARDYRYVFPGIDLNMAPGAVVFLTEDDAPAQIEWLVTPALIESTEELIEAARELADELPKERFTGFFTESGKPVFLDEKQGEYYYDDVTLKRVVLGDGGKSGNCDYCEDAADRGWVDQDEVFDGPDGEVDEPPIHINCGCTLETKDTTKRVYV